MSMFGGLGSILGSIGSLPTPRALINSALGGNSQSQPAPMDGGNQENLGGTIQTQDSGYTQNIAGLLQMLGANQNQPRTTVISGGGLI